MMNLRALLIIIVGSGAAITATAAGCSSEQPGGAGTSGVSSGSSSGTSSGSSGSSGTSGGEGGADGGSSGTDASSFGPEACNNAKQLGEEVAEVASPGAVPAPLGGTIQTGVYQLTEFRVYGELLADGGESEVERLTGVTAKKTLYVAGNLVTLISATSPPNQTLPPDQTTAFVFTVNGTSLATGGVCPDKGTKTIGFSAIGGGLALYPDGKHRELYLKQ